MVSVINTEAAQREEGVCARPEALDFTYRKADRQSEQFAGISAGCTQRETAVCLPCKRAVWVIDWRAATGSEDTAAAQQSATVYILYMEQHVLFDWGIAGKGGGQGNFKAGMRQWHRTSVQSLTRQGCNSIGFEQLARPLAAISQL